jgi:hypothetical protein
LWHHPNVEFFVPAATDENIDEVYASFAEMCHRSVPPPDRRIYSIRFIHDGTEWTATVGEPLRGTRTRKRRRRGQNVEVTEQASDPATVLAIFAGTPFLVVTNAQPITGVVSAWVNPFMAGQPESVTFFDAPTC